jgi:hypothetical protein
MIVLALSPKIADNDSLCKNYFYSLLYSDTLSCKKSPKQFMSGYLFVFAQIDEERIKAVIFLGDK